MLKDSAYDGVTIRQALDMRSGANYDEQYVVSHPDLLSATLEESFVENRMHFVSVTRAMTRAYDIDCPRAATSSVVIFPPATLICSAFVLERTTRKPLSLLAASFAAPIIMVTIATVALFYIAALDRQLRRLRREPALAVEPRSRRA
jgi:hypothetical protein